MQAGSGGCWHTASFSVAVEQQPPWPSGTPPEGLFSGYKAAALAVQAIATGASTGGRTDPKRAPQSPQPGSKNAALTTPETTPPRPTSREATLCSQKPVLALQRSRAFEMENFCCAEIVHAIINNECHRSAGIRSAVKPVPLAIPACGVGRGTASSPV